VIPAQAIRGALTLLPAALDSPQARVMLVAIGLQESRFTHRRQLVGNPPRATGPARGYWQFERGGGCAGVLTHQASRYWMYRLCELRHCKPTAHALWNAIEQDDVLAAAAARLLLFTDPRKLPEVGDEEGAWKLYLRTWRPGKPHRLSWLSLYPQAMEHAA
jgi:hypothetical protein